MTTIATLDTSLRDFVNTQLHKKIDLCFACSKCTAGCPVAYAMEYGPHRILQMIRFGLEDAVLGSGDIWLCTGCETCGARCPNDVNIAYVMDVLRQRAAVLRVRNPANDITNFDRVYLVLIKLFGRMHEASLMAILKILTRDFVSDLGAGAQLVAKGKIPLLPERIRGANEIAKMLDAPMRKT